MIALPTLISRAARHNPSGLATRFGDRDTTWTALEARVSRLAAGLLSLSVAPGERVALLSLNSDRFYEAMFAIPWAGQVLVPLNTRWAQGENHYALADCGARALVFDDHFRQQAEALLPTLKQLEHAVYLGDGNCPPWAVSAEGLIHGHGPAAVSGRSGDDLLGIFYTGGTTGFPKGVMQSHRALWASAVGAMPDYHMNRDSVFLHSAPMFHMADLAGSMSATLAAACNVILPAFDPGQVLRAVADKGVTHALLVPAMIKMLINHPEAATADVSSLRRVLYGASPMPAEVLKKCLETWPGVGLAQAYGQTELAPIATTLSVADHIEGGVKLKSAGRPTSVSEVRIVAEDGSDCPLGVTGEIAVRGPHTMLGYWNKPEETAKALRDGWVFTGDAGYFDGEGYLFIADRVKDMIISGGENVYTTEVENAVIGHPAVQDVAVIGIPHPDWGEAVHAIVVLRPGHSTTEEEVINHCRGRIAGYKLPKSVSFRSEPLPLSGAGKVLKTELRKPFWAGWERQVN